MQVKLIIELEDLDSRDDLISTLSQLGNVIHISKSFPIVFLITDKSNLGQIRSLPGVVQVTVDEKTSVQTVVSNRDQIVTTLEAKQTLNAVDTGYSGNDIKVAILDTGIKQDHPVLMNKVIDSFNFTESNTTDDLLGHGTHVAGILAGSNSESPFGVTEGMAPNVQLYNIKVLNDDGVGSLTNLIRGLEKAAELGVDLINFSGGAGPTDGFATQDKMINSLASLGINSCCATGNSGIRPVSSPSIASHSIAVGGYDLLTNSREKHSNFGGVDLFIKPDTVALSEDIASSCTGKLDGAFDGEKNDFEVLSGTSMACPMITGAIALLTEAKGRLLTREELEYLLSMSSTLQTKNDQVGYGLLNVTNAIQLLPDVKEKSLKTTSLDSKTSLIPIVIGVTSVVVLTLAFRK